MNETHVTIVGNALHSPDWRRTSSGAMVTTFKIASTARRYDGGAGKWIDGNSLRVRVSCWRSLAENVKNSVTSGDPLIVTGKLFTRDWEDKEGAKRTSWELEAIAVGHDLSKGRAVFERKRAQTATSEADVADAEARVGGELAEPVPDDEAPAQFNDMSFEEAQEYGIPDAPPGPGDGSGNGGDPAAPGWHPAASDGRALQEEGRQVAGSVPLLAGLHPAASDGRAPQEEGRQVAGSVPLLAGEGDYVEAIAGAEDLDTVEVAEPDPPAPAGIAPVLDAGDGDGAERPAPEPGEPLADSRPGRRRLRRR